MAELLISGARVVDGSGTSAFEGWVAIEGDRIAAVGPDGRQPPEAGRVVDAGGLVLAPGFIDVHSHADVVAFAEPGMDSQLRQGVTTLVVGNCGGSAFPGADLEELTAWQGQRPADLEPVWTTAEGYVRRLQACGPALNIAWLVGHGTLRLEAMGGNHRRPPTADEMAGMRRLLAEGLDAGAVGLSSGLIYQPGSHAANEELVELAGELAGREALYASHVRGESETVFEAVAECIEIGRRAGVPSHVSHLKVESAPMWGRAGELLALVDARRAAGDDVSADQYPYTAWETGLSALLPPWIKVEDVPRIVADDAKRGRLVHALEHGEREWVSDGRNTGWDRIFITFHATRAAAGRSIAELAEEDGVRPSEEALILLVSDPHAGMVGHGMHEDDVRTIVARADVMVGSDALAVSTDGVFGAQHVHPRYYGTFARVLGRYVRDEGLLPLETAVRKMTSLPAERFGLAGRGRIERGAFADLVLLDPESVADTATFEYPHSYAVGVDLVVVNGRISWDGGNRERAGRVLRRGER